MDAIAEQLPVSNEAKLPNRKPRPTPAQHRAVMQCYVLGQGSVAYCADKHGVSQDTAYHWADVEHWTEHRQAYNKREQDKILALNTPATPAEQLPKLTQPATSQQQKLVQVEAQLVAIDDALVEANARELPQLWKAKSMALDAWSLLTGFERPGIRRNKSKRSSYQSAQPIELDHEPVQPMPAKPMGWEYD